MRNLILEYNRRKYQIKKRIRAFRDLHKAKDEDIFSELCFCILTPQSKALYCDKAVKELTKSGLLFNGCRHEIRAKLKGVRFPNNKAAYLIAARRFFSAKGSRSLPDRQAGATGGKNGSGLDIKHKVNGGDTFRIRDWLVKNIKGLGYKEASHFLRNIGRGKDIAILDVHILKNLKKYKVIKKIPPSISKKTYLDIEDRMRKFSKKVNIPLEDLDLLFWSNQTGFIFK